MLLGKNVTLLCLLAMPSILSIHASSSGYPCYKEELTVAEVDDLTSDLPPEENNISEADENKSSKKDDTLEFEEDNMYYDNVASEDRQTDRHLYKNRLPETGQPLKDAIIESNNQKYEREQEAPEENLKRQSRINLFDKIKTALRKKQVVIEERDKRLSGARFKKTNVALSDDNEGTFPNESDEEDYDESDLGAPKEEVKNEYTLENHRNLKGSFKKKLNFIANKQIRDDSQTENFAKLHKAFGALVCAVENFMYLANKTMFAKMSLECSTIVSPQASFSYQNIQSTSKETTSASKEITSASKESTSDFLETTFTLKKSTSNNKESTSNSKENASVTTEENTSTLQETTYTSKSLTSKSEETNNDSKETTSASSSSSELDSDIIDNSSFFTSDTKDTEKTTIGVNVQETEFDALTLGEENCSSDRSPDIGESTILCENETTTTRYHRHKSGENARLKPKKRRRFKNEYMTPKVTEYRGGSYIYNEYDSVDPEEDVFSLVREEVSTFPANSIKRKSRNMTNSEKAIKGEEKAIIQKYSAKKIIRKKKYQLKNHKTAAESKSKKPQFVNLYSSRGKPKGRHIKSRGMVPSILHKLSRKFSDHGKNLEYSVQDKKTVKKASTDDLDVKTKSQNLFGDSETIELEYD